MKLTHHLSKLLQFWRGQEKGTGSDITGDTLLQTRPALIVLLCVAALSCEIVGHSLVLLLNNFAVAPVDRSSFATS